MLGEIDIFLPIRVQVATLASCAFAFFFLLEDDRPEIRPAMKPGAFVRQCNPFSAIWQSRRFMTRMMAALLAMYALTNIGYIGFDQCFNYYIRDQFGLTSGYNGVIKAALGVISLVANSTVSMWILRKKDTSRYMIGVMVICTATMIGVIALESLVPFIIVNVLFLAFYFVSMPLSQSMVVDLGGRTDSNLLMGVTNAMRSLGSIIGALSAGFLYGAQAKLSFVFGFIAFADATVLTVCYRRMEKKRKPA